MFDGVRVVELAQWIFVPATGLLMADWGADVIHIENPRGGDPFRGLQSTFAAPDKRRNLSMDITNRGKRSVAIDVQTERGRELLYQLLDDADVFLTNLRPSVLERLRLDPETVRARNPRLIYGRGNGLGHERGRPVMQLLQLRLEGGRELVEGPAHVAVRGAGGHVRAGDGRERVFGLFAVGLEPQPLPA